MFSGHQYKMMELGVGEESNPLLERNDVRDGRDGKFQKVYVSEVHRQKMGAKNRMLIDGKLTKNKKDEGTGYEVVAPTAESLADWAKQSEAFGSHLRMSAKDEIQI